MMIRRSWVVYGLLLAVWCAILGWQVVEHSRVVQAGRKALVDQAAYITSTLETVIRSQQRFGVIFSQNRLESALDEMVKMGELKSVMLLNASGAVVLSAGERVSAETTNQVQITGQQWGDRTVALMNTIDLGTNVFREGESAGPIIVIPPREQGGTNSDRRGPRPWRWPDDRERDRERNREEETNSQRRAESGPERSSDGGRRRGPPPFSPEEFRSHFRSLEEKQGLHSFLVIMSTSSMREAKSHDFWMRFMIGALGGVASAGLALAWRNIDKSSDLQFRLLRASELNNHLKEMNIAAAGLAHETRNPLNIIRGLAQIISNQPDATTEVRHKSRAITDEVDRITAQLNEFMSYSKPREVRRAPVALGAAIGEVGRALQYDLEDKSIQFSVVDFGLVIEADEQLLRQLLFNLLLNAIQAVEPKGEIRIVTSRMNANEAAIEVRDDGPGVPEAQREEIFKPYFTTHQKGTGLGLAVVQQIVLAHGWEIQCLSNEPKGAIFRLTHLKLSPAA